ncbi:MAG: tRNA (N(6)-L-threonylcarbamoyladenosine(37)-C(2))-methylthiotransferase MtaB [Lachnospiraceae bacterium]|nr:tRNA (N(6)-L-threonylcarbamoyladenosine(37)-C(2))-methylthiotransferase MtaB [Lachnospiraceae bacterium]
MKKAALHNLGCKVNAYETEAMQQLLEEAGYEIVPFFEQADVYVINTCSVTNLADRKSRQMLHRAKKQNPDSIVVAAGCYVQTAGEQAGADPAIDILIGNNRKHELPGLLAEYERDMQAGKRVLRREVVDINDTGAAGGYESLAIRRTAEHTRAFVKIQDGCDQFCSYCIIPYARGRVRSRSRSDLLKEIRALAQNGYQEVVLTGIHLSSYGADTGDSLLSLIEEIHKLPGISRIRLGSLEPKIVTEEFARALSVLPKVCPHFHLSLQSGCDETLRRMNRKYSCEEYRQGCGYLRNYFDHPALTTDIIVGFPGETEEEFAATRRFLQEIAFFEVHIFKYSVRRGTRAAGMEGQIPEQVKAERSSILFGDTEPMSQSFAAWYLGKTLEILVEERIQLADGEYYTGHTPEYIRVEIPVFEGDGQINRVVKCRAESLTENHILRCRPILTENMD